MPFHFTERGVHEVKHVARPVKVYSVASEPPASGQSNTPAARPRRRWLGGAALLGVAALAVAAWWLTRVDFEPVDPANMQRTLPDKPSIAVVPFDYFGADEASFAYLAQGLGEQVTTVLASNPNLFVME